MYFMSVSVKRVYDNVYASILFFTPDRRQSETLVLSTNVDQKSLETEFLIAICRPTGDKWQSKTLFLSIFDPRSSIVEKLYMKKKEGKREQEEKKK